MRVDWMMLVALSLAVPLIAMTSLLEGRLPGTHDAWLHLLRLINATTNLKEGILIPRWGPHLHFGFGYPLGNFYAPGWHIAGGVLALAGIPIVTIWLVFQTLGILLYSLGGYLFARLFTDRTGALLGAAVCLFAPLRCYEVFIQGNISQLVAMGLIAWVLWAFARCALAPSPRNIVLASVILSALIMTHHPTSTFAIPLAGAYSIFTVLILGDSDNVSFRRRLVAVLSAYGLGLLLAATYWLPALTELRYVHVQAAADQFQLQDNFVRLRDLIGPVRPPDRGSLNMPFTFSAGLGSLVLGVFGGGVALSPRVKLTRWQRGHVLAGLLLAVACLYLITYRSLWLWQAVPKADLILFPWRLLSVLNVALIPAAVMVVMVIPNRWRSWVVAILIMVLFGTMLPLMFPLYDNERDLGTVTPATSIRYEIESGNLGGVSNNEYLPTWATQRPDFAVCPDCYRDWNWQLFVNDQSLPESAQVTLTTAAHTAGGGFTLSSLEAFRLELHQMYFPGWQATVDGKPVTLITTEPYGLIALDIPAGEHNVQIWYAGTRVQHVANALSLVALGLCGVLLIPLHLHRRRSDPIDAHLPRLNAKFVLTAVAVPLTIAIVLRGIIAPNTNWFRAQGNRSAPPGMANSLGVVFVDDQGSPTLELIGYTLSDMSIGYSDWLFVTLYWQALTPPDQPWRVHLALVNPLNLSEWSVSDNDPPGGYSPLHWTTDRYVIDRHILRLDEDIPPYVGNLVVHVYTSEGAQLLVDNSTYLRLDQVRIDEGGTYRLPADVQPVDIIFGGWLRWRAYALIPQGDGYELRMYWQVLRAPPADYALMLHWLRAGEEIGNNDQPPIPAYPTSLWLTGQYLVSTIHLDAPAEADSLLIGLYDYPSTQRASIRNRAGDLAVQNDTIVLPLPSENRN